MTSANVAPVVVFDVNETLLDITTIEPLFVRIFSDRSVLREWFGQLIVYSQAMTLAGLYVPFGELATGTLHMVGSIHGVSITADDIDELKQRMSTMPAHPDVIPALKQLREAGLRLVTLTNSASAPPPTPLERAGIDGWFERAFSVEVVGKFKPAPETYRYVAQAMDVATADLCLVACHLWDTLGAQAAGCLGALVTRPGNAILPAAGVPEPNFVASTLTDLAGHIVGHWRDRV
ncbi:MAG: haloacid dehalogenase type II [Pseudomonadota bacterium]|nr:haloacid dehalogenase type II [Pseudomonadota bacterium]